MQTRTLLNLGLLGVIAILIAIVIYEPGKQAIPSKPKLTAISKAQVTSLRIHRPDQPDIVLHRQGEHWLLESPYGLPANKYRVQSLLQLVDEDSHSQLSMQGYQAATFQLDKPEGELTINDSVKILFGGKAPLKNLRYVQVGETLHTIQDNYGFLLNGRAELFIDYALLPADSKITRLELPDFTLAKKDDHWQINPKPKQAYSADALPELVNFWQYAQSLEAKPHPEKSSGKKIRISIAEQAPLEFRYEQQADNYYFIRTDKKIRYEVSKDTAEQLLNLPKPIDPAQETDSAPTRQ